MSNSTLCLVSAANGRFFPGLLVALGSALACASGRYNYRICVLDGGLASEDWASMESHLQRIAREKDIQLELHRIEITDAFFANMPSRRGSPLTWARLAIPSILNDSKVVYIDSDVVCLRGIEEFWAAINPDIALAAVRDPLGCLGRDPLTRQLPASKHGLPYFNAGIVGINVAHWREAETQAQISRLLAGGQSFRYADQSLLNLLFHDRWQELPAACNRVLTLGACGDLVNDGVMANLHYIGPRKPWLTPMSNFYRHAANLLFGRMHEWICQNPASSNWTVSPKSLKSARRKRLLYRFFLPGRGREYAAALASTANAATIVSQVWESWEQRRALPEDRQTSKLGH